MYVYLVIILHLIGFEIFGLVKVKPEKILGRKLFIKCYFTFLTTFPSPVTLQCFISLILTSSTIAMSCPTLSIDLNVIHHNSYDSNLT